MNALLALCALAAVAGTALVLAELPWFGRRSVIDRLRPYTRAGSALSPRRGTGEGIGGGIGEVLTPALIAAAERASRALGVRDPLELRLERAGRSVDPTTYRVHQGAVCAAALLVAVATAAAAAPSPTTSAIVVLGAPVLGFLLLEHSLSRAISARRERTVAELPVVVEQLGMLLRAGFSLQGGLARLADRSGGEISADLSRVTARIRGGLSVTEALSEWAERRDLDQIRRLVSVLQLHEETGDLGALISHEAVALRQAALRGLLERIERRSQIVWVPVTVATLVPGLIFLAVPFMSAMSRVTGS